MPALAYTGSSKTAEAAALQQMLLDTLMAAAARASVVARGVPNARLPEQKQTIEAGLAPMFAGSGSRARLLRRAFASRVNGRGAQAGLDFASPKSVWEQQLERGDLTAHHWGLIPIQPGRAPELTADLIEQILKLRRPGKAEQGDSDAVEPPPAAPQAKELQLRIKRVTCVEQVGWELTDVDLNDVILCGGLGFDSTLASPPAEGSDSTAHFRKVPKFKVDNFPKDGEVHTYSPAKVFCKWDLTADGEWPRAFFGIMALAEKDSGEEFIELIEQMWTVLTPLVLAAVDAAVTAVGGALAGAIAGTALEPGLGTLIGSAIGGAIGAFVGFAISTLRDDVLETSDTPVTFLLPSREDRIDGQRKSDVYTAEYVRPGMPGVYKVDYFWELAY